jgi:hypothetical protein
MYEVGDSTTAWPTNGPALVDEIIKRFGEGRRAGPSDGIPYAKHFSAIVGSLKRCRDS